MTDPAKQQKRALRRRFRAARNALSRSERQRAEREIVRRLKPLVKRGKTIALYFAMGSEADLSPLLRTAAQRRARIRLPYIDPGKKRMWFTPCRAGAQAERKRGRAKLNVPQFAGHRIRADRLNVMIVPIAAGFACQLADSLPREAHDIPLDGFVSERHRLRFTRR